MRGDRLRGSRSSLTAGAAFSPVDGGGGGGGGGDDSEMSAAAVDRYVSVCALLCLYHMSDVCLSGVAFE